MIPKVGRNQYWQWRINHRSPSWGNVKFLHLLITLRWALLHTTGRNRCYQSWQQCKHTVLLLVDVLCSSHEMLSKCPRACVAKRSWTAKRMAMNGSWHCCSNPISRFTYLLDSCHYRRGGLLINTRWIVIAKPDGSWFAKKFLITRLMAALNIVTFREHEVQLPLHIHS